ncbi:hypothetical protein JCM21900_003084 [Sporobolomyces salmonicolor]
MHTYFSAVAFALLASVSLAAPLSTRANTTVCSPEINGTITTKIVAADSTRDAWWPDLLDGYPVNVSIVTIGTMNTDPSPLLHLSNYGGNDQYRIAIHNDTSKCLSGRYGLIGSADCGSPLAAWTLTCETCRLNSGSECQFKATAVGECATVVEPDQPMNVSTCSAARSPDDYVIYGAQYFAFGA